MKVAIIRGEKKVLHIKNTISADQLLKHITADDVISHYRTKQYMLLDRIGKEYVKQYFNLKDNDE